MKKNYVPKKKSTSKKSSKNAFLKDLKKSFNEGPSVYALVTVNIAIILLLWADVDFTKYALPIVFAELFGYFLTRYMEVKELLYLLMGLLMFAFSVFFLMPIIFK